MSAGDILTAVYTGLSGSVSTLSFPGALHVTDDGETLYVSDVVAGAHIEQYTLGTAFDISTAAVASKSFDPSAQDANPRGFQLTADGSTLYIVGLNTDAVYQYTLGTAFDISTAAYASKSFSVAAEVSTPFGVHITADGRYAYVSGAGSGVAKVQRYALSTPFDISTAALSGAAFDASGQMVSGDLSGVHMSAGGTALYLLSAGTDTLYQYSLSTPFDVSSAAYDGQSYSFASEASFPRDVHITADGETLYALGAATKNVYQYTQTAASEVPPVTEPAGLWLRIFKHVLPRARAWSLTIDRTIRQFFDGLTIAGSAARSFVDLVWLDIFPATARQLDGWETQFGLPDVGLTTVERRDRLAAAWQALGGQSPSYIQSTLQARGFPVYVHEWWQAVLTRLSGGPDLSTAAYASKSFSVAGEDISPTGVHITADGAAAYIIGTVSATVYQYTLSTPFDASTAAYASKSFSAATQDAGPTDLVLSPDGTTLHIAGTNTDTVYQYTLSTPFDVSTAAYASKSFSVAAQDSIIRGLSLTADGTTLYIVGDSTNTVYQYTLGTAFDISTAAYASKSLLVGVEDNTPRGVAVAEDGTALYIVGSEFDAVYQYTLGTAFDVSTGVYASKSISVTAQDSIPTGLSLASDGAGFYVIGNNTDAVYQYTATARVPVVTTFPTVGVKACAPARDPSEFLREAAGETIYTVAAGEALALAGEAGALAGERTTPPGYPLVNKITRTLPDYTSLAGEAFMQAGEAAAVAGDYSDFRTITIDPQLPIDSAKWPFFVYIGGETYGEPASIDAKRRDEFEALCLKICPAHLWIGVIVEYN